MPKRQRRTGQSARFSEIQESGHDGRRIRISGAAFSVRHRKGLLHRFWRHTHFNQLGGNNVSGSFPPDGVAHRIVFRHKMAEGTAFSETHSTVTQLPKPVSHNKGL